MPKITAISRTGVEEVYEGPTGSSVMEALRDGGQGEILALCGGCCSCGTCHVYVAEEWLDKLPPMGEDERDLLSFSPNLTSRSRLSCQLEITEELDGLTVTVAPES